jgi:hypothetical protein
VERRVDQSAIDKMLIDLDGTRTNEFGANAPGSFDGLRARGRELSGSSALSRWQTTPALPRDDEHHQRRRAC